MVTYIKKRIVKYGLRVGQGYRLACDWVSLHQYEGIYRPYSGQLASALCQLLLPLPRSERGQIRAIEQERQRMLRCDDPLVDGTLGEGGLFDRGHSIQEVCLMSKPPRAALLLYRLIREFDPLMIIELGTNVGISSAYMAAAQAANGRGGQLVTLESSPYRIRLASALHRTLGFENVRYVPGLFSDTLELTLQSIPPVDFAFIDGHHRYQPTLDYFDLVSKRAALLALFVFDDIRWSEEMERAWALLQADRRLDLIADLGTMGIGLTARGKTQGRVILPPVYGALKL